MSRRGSGFPGRGRFRNGRHIGLEGAGVGEEAAAREEVAGGEGAAAREEPAGGEGAGGQDIQVKDIDYCFRCEARCGHYALICPFRFFVCRECGVVGHPRVTCRRFIKKQQMDKKFKKK